MNSARRGEVPQLSCDHEGHRVIMASCDASFIATFGGRDEYRRPRVPRRAQQPSGFGARRSCHHGDRPWPSCGARHSCRPAHGAGTVGCRRQGDTRLETQGRSPRADRFRQHGERPGDPPTAMIVYLDTSALVPLMVREPTSGSCAEIWDSADAVVGTRLCYVEAVAALTMAVQMGKIGPDVQEECVGVLDELWSGVDVIELDETLMRTAS